MPSSYHHGQLADALFAAAREQLLAGGAEAVSLRSVSQAVGVSHAAVYRHYRSRRHLLSAVAVDALESLAAALERAGIPSAATPLGALEALAGAYVRWALERPSSLRLAFAAELWDKEDLPELRAAADRASRPLADAIAALGIPPRERRGLAVAVWAQVHGTTVLAVDRQLDQGELRVEEPGTEALVTGVVAAVRALVSGWPGREGGTPG